MYNGPRCDGNLVIPNALQSLWRSRLAVTDMQWLTDRTNSSKHKTPATIQIIFAILDGLASKTPPPCFAPDVYSFAYSAGEVVPLSLTATTLTLNLNHLSRTPCRFPEFWYWFTPERSCRATLETVMECRPVWWGTPSRDVFTCSISTRFYSPTTPDKINRTSWNCRADMK